MRQRECGENTLPYEPNTEISYLDELVFDKGNMYILNDGVIYILTDDMDLSRLEDPPLDVDKFRAASLNGYIYAVGGFDNESDISPCTAPKNMPGMSSQHLPFSTLII